MNCFWWISGQNGVDHANQCIQYFQEWQKNTNQSDRIKFPTILPKKAILTNRVVEWFHKKVQHSGRSITACEIRNNGYWIIGGNSTVQPGCTIGEGAVVANRAVLPKWTDIPAGEIWGGVPAKCIRLADGSKPD